MGGAVLGNLEIDEQTGMPIPCRPSGHDVWLRGLHGVQGQVRVGEGATSSHLRDDPDRLHDLLGSVALADVQLGVALDAVWALGDVRDGYRDELLGLLGQRRYMSSTELRCSQCAVRQLHHVRRQRLTLRIRILPGTRSRCSVQAAGRRSLPRSARRDLPLARSSDRQTIRALAQG
jgi:hypothetical protein